MPWFVLRVSPSMGPENHKRFFLQRNSYATRDLARENAHDNSRLINPDGVDVDETVEPFIVEAHDSRDAVDKWMQQM